MLEDYEMEDADRRQQPEIRGAIDMNQGDNPFAPVNGENSEQKPKRQMGPRTFTEQDLYEKQNGLNLLFTDMVLNRDKMNLKGKGHEMSDFAKIMAGYRKWHLQFAPKLQFDFAINKISRMGAKKSVVNHLDKLRKVYKGEEEIFFEVINQAAVVAPPEVSLLAPSNFANQFNIEKAQAQQAEKERERNVQFEMLDDEPIQIDTRPQLTEEQLRIMEQNRLKAVERKRLRELEQEAEKLKRPVPPPETFKVVYGGELDELENEINSNNDEENINWDDLKEFMDD